MPVRYGGFWKRLVAFYIDVFLVLSTLLLPRGDQVWAGWIVGFGNFILMECSPWQGTVGKKLLSLKTTNYDGGRLTWIHAIGRAFAKVLLALSGVGHLFA